MKYVFILLFSMIFISGLQYLISTFNIKLKGLSKFKDEDIQIYKYKNKLASQLYIGVGFIISLFSTFFILIYNINPPHYILCIIPIIFSFFINGILEAALKIRFENDKKDINKQ